MLSITLQAADTVSSIFAPVSTPVQGASTEASVAALSELLGDLSCEIVKDFGRPPAAR